MPAIPLPDDACPRRLRLMIDLMLLTIEALDLGGSEAILAASEELELQSIIKNRVTLWLLRSTNPLRRYSQRRPLRLIEAKALVAITCHLSRRLTVLTRQLLLAYQQLDEKQLSVEHHFRLSEYLERFRVHFCQRMNPRRMAIVAQYTRIDIAASSHHDDKGTYSDEGLNQLAIFLLERLLFCTGTAGMQRFWVSLFDGEIE
ncbi:DUF3038 domain-containing protein [Leptolyngbya sp. 'hensonii']|uniref:DUF3038 domain-containing protein n=1 Tax=Leptolyngbya sp. 'hensonii' TaxID=1922337 RepID=UPI00341F69A0